MPETTDSKHSSRWRKGVSGNPAGRPKGSRHVALRALDALGADSAQAILAAVIKAARGGDMRACEILLSRVWPARKGRTVSLTLPDLKSGADLVTAMREIVTAATDGTLTLEEANGLAELLDVQRRVLETEDLERRISALEQTNEPTCTN